MPIDQEDFEKKLMLMLLAGNNFTLSELRFQYENSQVKFREFTGVGFFTHFSTKSEIKPLAKRNFEFGDICGDLGGTKCAMGFFLFVRDGYLDWIEGFTFSIDEWPDNYFGVDLYYVDDNPKGNIRTNIRDLSYLIKKFSN